MAKCHLIIDSCCDLPASVVRRPGVTLMKFPYTVDGGTFEDDLFESVSAEAFYGAMRKGAEPSTAQVTLQTLTDTFTAAAEEGTPAVYLAFSSGLSASFDAACVVRDQVLAEHPDFELHIVDTHLASVAEGLLVYEALGAAREGHVGRRAGRLGRGGPLLRERGVHGGRPGGPAPRRPHSRLGCRGRCRPGCEAAARHRRGRDAVAGRGVARGRKKGIKQLAEYYKKNVDDAGQAHVAIVGHADCPKDAARLKEALEKEAPGLLCLVCNIGPVIGSHVGADMLAVVFWGHDKRENLSVADRIARKVKGDK